MSAAIFGLLAFVVCGASAIAAPSLEWAVKAAYLLKLPPFIAWPGNALVSSSGSFNLCIVGGDPFGDLLERGAAGQRLGGQPVAILHLNAASPAAHCQMMYVTGDPQSVAQNLEFVDGTPVLTVTDSEDDSRAKGIVNFVLRDNHVRFEIDRAAAARNHLDISSKLLGIAVSDGSGRSDP